MTAPKSRKDDAGFIPAEWKDHVVKTLITMALGGLGTLMVVCGTYVLNSNDTVQKVLALNSSAKLELAKFDGRKEFCDAALKAVEQAGKRIHQFDQSWENDKSPSRFDNLKKIVSDSLLEVEKDSGSLAGYTPDATGLPVVFHNSVNGFFKTDMQFWRIMSDALNASQTKKLSSATQQEIKERLVDIIYESSLMASSWQDMLSVSRSEYDKFIQQGQAIEADVQHEVLMRHLAIQTFVASALVFVIIVCILVLDKLQGRKKK